MEEERVFYCSDDDLEFQAIGHRNPVFYADTVVECPKCHEKCWEKMVKIPYSEYKRLKEIEEKWKIQNIQP